MITLANATREITVLTDAEIELINEARAKAAKIQEKKEAKTPLYKVVKIGRKSLRRSILRCNLTEADAQRVVRSYPDSTRSMVVYQKQ
jgi:hypothetical protein